MKDTPSPRTCTEEKATEISIRAGQVFTPRTPISHRALFAGRWDEIQRIVDIVSQVGLHAVMYGERGVGKTSLANVIPFLLEYFDGQAGRKAKRICARVNAVTTDTFGSVWAKAFDAIAWSKNAPSIGFVPTPGVKLQTLREVYGLGPDPSIEEVRRVLSGLKESVFVIDEFDRLRPEAAVHFTDLIKALSDGIVDCTVVIVGVAETVDNLVKDHASITRALVQIPLERMKPNELRDIITKAEEQLGVTFETDAGESIVLMSQGLPHYTHLIGLSSVRAACTDRSMVVRTTHVSQGFERSIDEADQTIAKQYANATVSAQAAALYGDVLLACALSAASRSDDLGYFQPVSLCEPLAQVLRRDVPADVSTFNKHLKESCEDKRGRVLERVGRERAYRYRFRDPLMPPYVLLRGIADKLISVDDLPKFMRS